MAFAVIHRFAGGTKEQYDNAVAVVHPKDGLPSGQTMHVAGIADGTLIVFAVFDSEDVYVAFRDETLVPSLSTLENGPPGPPEETTFEVHNLQTA